MTERYTVAGILRSHAQERPDEPMLRCGDETRTWAETYRRAGQVAHALTAEGVGPTDRVAFLDKNGIAFFEVLFGGALMGAVNVAVNWRLAPVEMAAIINDAKAAVLVVHPDYLSSFSEMVDVLPLVRRIVVLPVGDPSLLSDPRIVGFEEWLEGRSTEDPGHRGAPDEVSMQLYTSGTTGLPKGVMLTNANFETAIGLAGDTFRIVEDTVSLVAMPLFHIGGSGWALSAMSRGGRSVILREVDPPELLRLIETYQVTEAFLVPAVLMILLATPAIESTDLTSLRNIFYGASPISEEVLVRCLKQFGCGFTQVYGMTETTGAICSLLPEDHEPDGPRRALLRSAGKPFSCVELRIVDPDTGSDMEPGVVGELWTRSPFNMSGYWQKAEETAASLVDEGWLRTGDAGYLDEEGYLFLHDRVKDMIVTGGENVYPAEIENALMSFPGVADAAVIGVPDDRWGETVKAIVVAAPGETIEPEKLIAHCRERLAHFKCPTSVDFIEVLPRNPSGKVLKRELRDPYWAGTTRRIN